MDRKKTFKMIGLLKEKKEQRIVTLKEVMLIELEKETEKEILGMLNRESKLRVVIIDGVDGVGKSTVVEILQEK